MLWECTFIRETSNFLPTNDLFSVWLWRAHLFKHVHAQLRQTKVLSWSLKMILLRKNWRCAEMTRGLTAKAGPCSTNHLLNAVKQAGNKKVLFSQRNSIISSVKSVSLKKSLSKWPSTEPWRPVDPRWEAGREVLQLPLYSDQGSPGGTWPLLLLWGSLILAQGSRILRWDFASFASLGILDPCSRIKDSYVEVF